MTAESNLAAALGFGPGDLARPAAEERAPLAVPVSEEASIEKALEGSNELKRLQSNIQAKMLEIKSYHAERLPKVNLVAQYSLFAKYNYQDYFSKFQRNNAQVGASIEIPLIVGRTASAQSAQSEADIAKLRIEVNRTRTRITVGSADRVPKSAAIRSRLATLPARTWTSRARNSPSISRKWMKAGCRWRPWKLCGLRKTKSGWRITRRSTPRNLPGSMCCGRPERSRQRCARPRTQLSNRLQVKGLRE